MEPILQIGPFVIERVLLSTGFSLFLHSCYMHLKFTGSAACMCTLAFYSGFYMHVTLLAEFFTCKDLM